MVSALEFDFGFYSNPVLRARLNRLVLEVFGLDFGPWNELAFEGCQYTPFTFFEAGRAIANVSASPMPLFLGGRQVTAIQVGTVCTLPDRRKGGLVRELMERAHAYWDSRCEFSYLFANESVLDFYQQFGYRPVDQHFFRCIAPPWRAPTVSARSLNIGEPSDFELMIAVARERAPISNRLGVLSQVWLWLFHAAVAHPENLLFIEPLEAIAVSRLEGRTLHVYDLVARESLSFEDVYPFLGSESIEEVRFHFTPDLMDLPGISAIPAQDTHLFVRGNFPEMTHPFLFPSTSEA